MTPARAARYLELGRGAEAEELLWSKLSFVMALAKSMRSGPTGEFHIKLAPTDERIEELSARHAGRAVV